MDGTSGAQLASVKSRATSYTGIAFRPGDRELWASETTSRGPDSLLIVHLSSLGAVENSERLALPRHPLPAGIAFSADGKTYEIRNRMTLCRCGRSDNKPFCNGSHAA